MSVVFGVGTRIVPKNEFSKASYLIDFRWQRFNSDIVEGLKPKLSANKDKDFLLFLSVGYVYSFN